jgi:hypothetical protein
MVLEPIGQLVGSGLDHRSVYGTICYGERWPARRIGLRGRASMNPGE